jgi:hypothetical protein
MRVSGLVCRSVDANAVNLQGADNDASLRKVVQWRVFSVVMVMVDRSGFRWKEERQKSRCRAS